MPTEPPVTASPARRMAAVAAAGFVLAGLIVLGTSVQTYMQVRADPEEEATLWEIAQWPAAWWFGWVLLAPFCFELAWRRPITRDRPGRRLAVLAAAGAVAFVLHVAYQVAWMFTPAFDHIHPDLADAVGFHTLSSLYLNVFAYWIVVACALGLRAYRREQQRALRAAQLEAELTAARLDALKAQLHPHFLFNTLHGVSALMYRDVAAADAMVTRLGRLLRRSLDRSDAHEVPLREELDVLEEYLAIERLRFGDGLRTEMEVAPGLDDALVPSFVFQPLVENALKYAVAPSGNRGTVALRAWTEGDRLRLSVADDGPGLGPDAEVLGAGVGLSNLHDRLARLYGDAFALDLRDAEPHGLVVELTLPLRRSSPEGGVRPSPPPAVPDAEDPTG